MVLYLCSCMVVDIILQDVELYVGLSEKWSVEGVSILLLYVG